MTEASQAGKNILRRPIFWILVSALILRLTGITFGLPYVYHQDEPIVVNHAMAIGAEGWNTRTYLPPQFASYFLFTIYGVFFILAKITGAVSGAEAFAAWFLKDPTAFYVLGRLALGVFPGVATVYLLWKLARRFFSEEIALFSSALLAVVFLHVQHSHYIYIDIALTFTVLAMLHHLLSWQETPSMPAALKTGALFGLTVAVKYTAVYFFPAILFVFFLEKKVSFKDKFLQLICLGILSVAVYAAISPYSFLDWENFRSQVAGQSQVRGYWGPTHHLIYSILGGTGFLFLGLAVVGIPALMRVFVRPAIVFLAAAMGYYAVNVYFSQPFPRYMMPMIPFLCLFAAAGIAALGKILKNRFLFGAIVLAVFTELLIPAVYSNYLMSTRDTRTQMLEWVQANIPEKSVIAVDHRFFGPPLLQTREQVEEKYSLLAGPAGGPAKRKRLDLTLKVLQGQKTYAVYVLTNAKDVDDAFLFYRPSVFADPEELKKIGAEYLVFNYAEVDAKKHALKLSMGDSLELVRAFSPYRSPRQKLVEDPYAATSAPHAHSDLFSRKTLGPYIEIYRVKP